MKSIFLSRTFWIQVIALAALLAPPVKVWFDSNPVPYVAVFAALNVVVRFVTSGAVSILPGDDEKTVDSGRLPGWVLPATLAGLVGFSLPACSTGGAAIPMQACYIDGAGNKICYSTVEGITATVDRRSGK